MDIFSIIGSFFVFSFNIVTSTGLGLIFLPVLVWMLFEIYLHNAREKYRDKIEFILLSVSVPQLTDEEQSMLAVEQIFSALYGIKSKGTKYDQYIQGKVQDQISMEIVSLGGEVKFFVYTPAYYKDLVEVSIFGQYPTAEINVVDDYVNTVPSYEYKGPYNFFGSQLVLAKPDGYPIRTYREFEHQGAQQIIDPLGSIVELMTNIDKREQMWIQFVIRPVDDHWKESAQKIANKIAGKPSEEKEHPIEKYIIKPLQTILSIVFSSESEGESKSELPSLMQHLTPGERRAVEAIELNTSKNAFEVYARYMYLAPSDIYEKNRKSRVAGLRGAFAQFATQDLNSFKEDKRTRTIADYFLVDYRLTFRRHKLLRAYKKRAYWLGSKGFIFNIEELATVWHFPLFTARAPMVQQVEAKKGEPPRGLPVLPV